MTDISGWTAPGFEAVRDAFEANFAAGREVGAAFAAYHHGELVADLWGGVADPETERAWAEDTMVVVYSSTKGATATCAHVLAEAGRLDVDAPVAECWPEFAQAGKEAITVADLLSHQAGLAWVDEELTLEQVLAWEPLVDALARQAPLWEPRSAHGYHAVTYGNLVGEVVRRIDGRSLGTFFAEEIARRSSSTSTSDCPRRSSRGSRCWSATWAGSVAATPRRPAPTSTPRRSRRSPSSSVRRRCWARRWVSTARSRVRARSLRRAATSSTVVRCTPPSCRLQMASPTPARSRACTRPVSARSTASGCCPRRGCGTPRRSARSGPDIVILNLDLQFGLGYFVRSTLLQLGGPGCFGHAGAGGSLGWADPDAGVACGYVMNRMDLGLAGDLRSYSLVEACYAAAERT